jgi:hypothetical protein
MKKKNKKKNEKKTYTRRKGGASQIPVALARTRGKEPPTGNVISGGNTKKVREIPSRDLWSLPVAMVVVLLYYIMYYYYSSSTN